MSRKKGGIHMTLKKNIKRGLFIFAVYSFITLCLLLTAERVERLEKSNFRNDNTSFSIHFFK